jgi:hypothetical protein
MLETKLFGPALKILELSRVSSAFKNLPPALPRSVLRLMRQEIRLDVRRAASVLGVTWKSLDQGLEETARWYHREGDAA